MTVAQLTEDLTISRGAQQLLNTPMETVHLAFATQVHSIHNPLLKSYFSNLVDCQKNRDCAEGYLCNILKKEFINGLCEPCTNDKKCEGSLKLLFPRPYLKLC